MEEVLYLIKNETEMGARITSELLGCFFADSPTFGQQQFSVGIVEGLSVVYETVSLLSTNRSNALRPRREGS